MLLFKQQAIIHYFYIDNNYTFFRKEISGILDYRTDCKTVKYEADTRMTYKKRKIIRIVN